MTTSAPALGLLLDVDGPIASPVSRTIAIESIVEDLVALAGAGTPIAFNTGRSDAFIREQVLGPLRAAGLPRKARVHAVCEKGAVWFSFAQDDEQVHMDSSLVLPEELRGSVRDLVTGSYADAMFLDETKRTMISVEQRVDVGAEDYRRARAGFDREVLSLVTTRGYGVEVAGAGQHPDADGAVALRIDPNIIATDLESVRTGKALGASRALGLLDDDGRRPLAWRTMGDSRSDYAMADWLHAQALEVVHVDVRPGEGLLTRPYRVLSSGDLVHDEAGAMFLGRWVAMLATR